MQVGLKHEVQIVLVPTSSLASLRTELKRRSLHFEYVRPRPLILGWNLTRHDGAILVPESLSDVARSLRALARLVFTYPRLLRAFLWPWVRVTSLNGNLNLRTTTVEAEGSPSSTFSVWVSRTADFYGRLETELDFGVEQEIWRKAQAFTSLAFALSVSGPSTPVADSVSGRPRGAFPPYSKILPLDLEPWIGNRDTTVLDSFHTPEGHQFRVLQVSNARIDHGYLVNAHGRLLPSHSIPERERLGMWPAPARLINEHSAECINPSRARSGESVLFFGGTKSWYHFVIDIGRLAFYLDSSYFVISKKNTIAMFYNQVSCFSMQLNLMSIMRFTGRIFVSSNFIMCNL